MPLNYSPPAPRPLPVFVLADTSGSMKGDKIDTLNQALRKMLLDLQSVSDLRAEIEIGVIAFGDTVKMVQPLAPPANITLPNLVASGKTPMGSALDAVRTLLEDAGTVSARAFLPGVILISDGLPTDLPPDLATKVKTGAAGRSDFASWSPIHALQTSQRAGRALRLAMGVGDDAGYEMLSAFVNTPGVPVIRGHDSQSIVKFLRWVTLSVASRSVSRTPDTPLLADLDAFSDGELKF